MQVEGVVLAGFLAVEPRLAYVVFEVIYNVKPPLASANELEERLGGRDRAGEGCIR